MEDDENKRQKLNDLLRALDAECVITEARSLNSGLRALLADAYDVIVVDMSMTTFDVGPGDPSGGRHQSFGGQELIRQMARHKIRTPVIVVTAFTEFGTGPDALTVKELDQKLSTEYADVYRGLVFYSPAESQWQAELAKRIEMLRNEAN